MAERLSCPEFVGRARELAQLAAALAESGGRIVLVEGEAGIGKTRLVDTFTAELDVPVLRGACLPLAKEVAYGPVVEILREAGRTRWDEDLSMGAFFWFVADVLKAMAPAVVVLEDLHWADASTRDLLLFLVNALRDNDILLIATVRTDELTSGVLAQLARTRRADRVRLRPFDRDEVEAQLAGILGRPPEAATVDLLLGRAEGNPFYTEELLAAGQAAIPDTVRDALLARVSRVGGPARHVLSVAAVLGRPAEEDLLTDSGDDGLREVLRHRLLVLDGDRYAFRHGLTREATYLDLLPGERSRLHEWVAATLEQRGGGLSEIAHHWAAAGRPRRALVASLRAGLAVRPNAPAQALAQFEGVVRLWPDVPDAAELTGWSWHDLLVRSAELASLAGANLKARDLVGRALDEVDRAAAPVRAAVLLERFGRYCWLAGVAGARDAREEAVALVAGLPASVEHATVLAAMAQDLMLRSRYRDAIGYARRARDMADGVVAAHAADTLGVCLCMDGQEREGLDLLRWALTAATGLGDAAEIGRAYLNLSEMLTFAGRFAEALRYGQEGVEVTRKLGLTGMFTPFIQGNVVRLLFRLGRWDDAAELAAEVLDGAGENWPRVGVSIPLAAVRIRRGQLDEAQRLLDDVAPLIDSVQAGYSRNEVIRRRCELAIARRDWDRARAAVREGLEVSDTTMWEPLRPVLCALGVRIEADALQEARLAGRRVDHAAAVARADRLLADCAEDTAGYALLARAERTRLDARPDPLAWAEVVRNRDAASDSYQAAYARWRQAEALLACRSPRGGASPFLREARLMAVGLGAAPLVAEVDALAARAGVDLAERRVPVDRPVARLGLTQREAEVLSLLGRGLTNGDIARALFISTKTASVHVSAILRKLGVASRTQAAAYAGSEVAGRRI